MIKHLHKNKGKNFLCVLPIPSMKNKNIIEYYVICEVKIKNIYNNFSEVLIEKVLHENKELPFYKILMETKESTFVNNKNIFEL